MKFIQKPNNEWTGWTHYRVSEKGLVHVGVYRVMYGHRVRAGFVADKMGCTLDWCGGANWKDVERLYSLCIGVLSRRDETPNCFEGIPQYSIIKPFYLDERFTRKVIKLAGEFEMISLEVSDVGGAGLHEFQKSL